MAGCKLFFGAGMIVGLGIAGAGCNHEASIPEEPAADLRIAIPDESRAASAGPFRHWQAKWQAEAEARAELVPVATDGYLEKVRAGLSGDSPAFDAALVPSTALGDLVAAGLVQSIDALREGRAPTWQDASVVPAARRDLTWNGPWLSPPHDSDAMLLYYREDVLTDAANREGFAARFHHPLPMPPRSWADVLDICDYFATRDWNGNGRRDESSFAAHFHPEGTSAAIYLAVAAPFCVNPGPGVTRYHNVFFLDPVSLDPLLESPGHVRGLETVRKLATYGEKSQLDWSRQEAWSRFLQGKALFCLGTGFLAKQGQRGDASSIAGKIGVAVVPGSKEVWSLRDRRWKSLNQPNQVGNSLGENWRGVIAAQAKNPALAYHYFAFHANRRMNCENVANPAWDCNPGRSYLFLPPQGERPVSDYLAAGWCEHDVTDWLAAFHENFTQTIGWIDAPRFPLAGQFLASLEEGLRAAMANPSIHAETILADVSTKWRALVTGFDQAHSPGRFRELYQQAIGYRPE